MLHPQHYLDSCTAVLGFVGVIDHNPGYISAREVAQSDLKSKLELLYQKERARGSFYFRIYGYTRSMSLGATMGDKVVAWTDNDDWLDCAFEAMEDSMEDDMECG
jgi:hypothetical protein